MIWKQFGGDAASCLEKDLKVFENYYGIKIKGVASHGGLTGLNNLEFWKKENQQTLDYYMKLMMRNPLIYLIIPHISDSEWTRWKCYQNGAIIENDTRSLTTSDEFPGLVYLLIHSDTYYDQHIYE